MAGKGTREIGMDDVSQIGGASPVGGSSDRGCGFSLACVAEITIRIDAGFSKAVLFGIERSRLARGSKACLTR